MLISPLDAQLLTPSGMDTAGGLLQVSQFWILTYSCTCKADRQEMPEQRPCVRTGFRPSYQKGSKVNREARATTCNITQGSSVWLNNDYTRLD